MIQHNRGGRFNSEGKIRAAEIWVRKRSDLMHLVQVPPEGQRVLLRVGTPYTPLPARDTRPGSAPLGKSSLSASSQRRFCHRKGESAWNSPGR